MDQTVPLTAEQISDEERGIIWTTIPARLDRLPWSRFHMVVVIALGITWILDGLEVTIVGALGPILQRSDTLGLSASEIGAAASFYVAGAVFGALLFGWMTDRMGRKQIFFLTLGIYILGVAGSAVSFDMASFAVARFLTGIGIGGEYAAINSAIDELVPARLRGRVDLIVNATFWAGAALGSAGTMLLLHSHVLSMAVAWRALFGIGAFLGLCVIGMRAWVPESPRWLMTHRRVEEATAIINRIEAQCAHVPGAVPAIRIYAQGSFGLRRALLIMATQYRARVFYVMVLMVSQAFLYNAVFFTYGMVLTHYDAVAPDSVGLYLLPLAIGNLLGPILLGPFFDTIGRRRMIGATYGLSALLMIGMTIAFVQGEVGALGQTLLWAAIFFFASAAASSAYLTASEIFPLEMRALAIALFYAGGTLFGGVFAPFAFSLLIGHGARGELGLGYVVAAALMAFAALVALVWGVDAEGRSLEDVAPPLGGGDMV
ncbi:MFS transporter [Tanticharoenia sakaeratensis]|uniref:Major facilitator superfamily protein n=1 Tax=Tanticharoenia sakaeratensis NBRC 103193 TaxID=1231623 RepID=A0A0D6MMM8_9PROT|nr:MFS transporter [Tanticharoenia sakaeratensis]GAN54538.1 major facilitator superfamily protein [Tanticharoenia sakaeratensis NBRC 103193]GBQ24496.1 major facilitator superfamily transporter [Tanticharoenia sakaeratensis NBRC 103193]